VNAQVSKSKYKKIITLKKKNKKFCWRVDTENTTPKTMSTVVPSTGRGLFGVSLVWGLSRCGRCVRFVGLAGVSGCVNGGLVSVETRFWWPGWLAVLCRCLVVCTTTACLRYYFKLWVPCWNVLGRILEQRLGRGEAISAEPQVP
jgi:hypothetical protein